MRSLGCGRSRRMAAAVILCLAGATALASECSISASGVVFGSYEPSQLGPLDAAGTVGVTCWWRNPPGYTPHDLNVSVRLGTGSSGTYASRTLRTGPNVLQYNLYADPARAQVWGDGTGGTAQRTTAVTVHRYGPSVSQSLPVYGRIFALQDPGSGAYVDTIVVTVEW
jgi:spore coat protein U-like protein